MDKETVKKIIAAANMAPSGGNSQPWKFRVQDNSIYVTGLPEKDHPVLNFRNRGTLVALGALMENMEIAGQAIGYKVSYEFIEPLVFKGVFVPGQQSNELFNAVQERHSNRKFYKTEPLTAADKYFLLKDAAKFPECEVILIEGGQIKKAAASTSVDILVSLQNKELHRLLFNEVLFNEEDQKHRSGLYLKTMEVSGPQSFIFKLLKNWKVAQFFHKAKITQKIYQESAKKTAASGALIAIAVSDDDRNFVQAGRLLENIWLRATKLGLSGQMVSSVLFLWQQLNFGKREIFLEAEKQIINSAYEKLAGILGIKNKTLALIFRIGKSDKPMAVSYKRPPEIE